MTKKGVYPYDYMDRFDKFEETPMRKDDFYSILADEHVSDDAYQYTENVWRAFELENMGGYHHLYLNSDVLSSGVTRKIFRQMSVVMWA